MSGARLGDITIRVETWNPQVSGTREVIRYIDISSIDGRKKAIRAPVRVPAADAPSRARQIVREGDVIVSTVRPGLNAVARIPSNLDGATASTGFCVLRPEKTRLNADYLFHWVRSSTFVRHLVSRATGANYPAVTDRVILDSKISLPSLTEQRRIAELLDRADAVQWKREESRRLVDDLLRSVFLEMFGDPVRNEKGWEVVGLGDCLLLEPKIGTIRPAEPNGAWKLVRVGEIGAYEVDLDECGIVNLDEAQAARAEARNGDILLARAIGSEQHLGKTSILQETSERVLFDSHVMRLRLDQARLVPSFLWFWLRSPGGRRLVMKGGGRTAVQFNINAKQIVRLRLPRPPLEAQYAFDAIIQRARTLDFRLAAGSDQLRTSLEGCLHEPSEPCPAWLTS